MILEFDREWTFAPPEDGKYCNKQIPTAAKNEIFSLIGKVCTQGDRQPMLEHFKRYFCSAAGETHTPSSSAGWAETDLIRFMDEVANNAPLFIDALFDALVTLKGQDANYYVPGEKELNALFQRHRIGYTIHDNRLLLRDKDIPNVKVEAKSESLDDRSHRLVEKSLTKAEELLMSGNGKGAVAETLWLLETVSTAFRGTVTRTGTIEGKYFNQIIKELRTAHPGSTLERVLEWAASLHGFLSSPTGGGVRHGLDLNDGLEPTLSESHLYVNLIRSYIGYLLAEHNSIAREKSV